MVLDLPPFSLYFRGSRAVFEGRIYRHSYGAVRQLGKTARNRTFAMFSHFVRRPLIAVSKEDDEILKKPWLTSQSVNTAYNGEDGE